MATRAGRRLEVVEGRPQPKTLSVEPLNPVIGAEIGGVDLSKPLTDERFADIRDALNAHHVLVFRDQHISREDHKRFGRLFGPLHVHPYHAKNTAPEHARSGAAPDPEILVVKADQSSRFVAGEEWHTDVTCDELPPMGSMLYITKTPESGGGDTCFASTIRAYEALSPKTQGFLEGLTATHDGAKPYTGGYGQAAPTGGWPKNTHPVVIRHPGNGKQALFVNRGFTTRINELDRLESEALLEFLWRHIETHLEFQCRVRWAPNTLVFWDNRCTQHHAVWDYYPFSRYGERVSIVGERPAV
ncbi:MAG: TauD/TfdA dioxygenase family protein [Caulobacterales bacterium]